MATNLKSLSEYNIDSVPSATQMQFGIVVSDYNADITHSLLQGCYDTLLAHGALESHIAIRHVPGAYELPLGATLLYDQLRPHAVICLGCVITGETKHDDYINIAVAHGIMQLNLQYKIPFVFGLLTPRNHEQALDRSGGKHGNKGVECAIAAIKMASWALQ